MKTVKDMVKELEGSKSDYVTYGDGDLGIPVRREDAILDIGAMEDIQIGEGTWYECDENGNITE